jgi:hypothetical protein
MKEILDELIEFSNSYLQPDLLAKNREMFSRKKDQLNEKEKHLFLDYLARKGKALVFLAFCDEVEVSISLSQAKDYSKALSVRDITDTLYDADLEINEEFTLKMSDLIDPVYKNEYLRFMLELVIVYDYLSTLQALLKLDKESHFIIGSYNDYRALIEKQPDERIGENIRLYLQDGSIGDNWSNYIKSYKYVPDILVDYFETEGKETCKENLKLYKKSKLLSKNTTLEELDAFVDQYNWDDGIEIPYFIMHHKNCDLALRKKLFELGAGECIDEKTYVDIKRDPWKQFILELKEMIEKEEK